MAVEFICNDCGNEEQFSGNDGSEECSECGGEMVPVIGQEGEDED